MYSVEVEWGRRGGRRRNLAGPFALSLSRDTSLQKGKQIREKEKAGGRRKNVVSRSEVS